MSIGRIVFSVDCQRGGKCNSEENAFKVPRGSFARLTPLHETHHISVNFANFFIKFGGNILETYVFQKM